MTIRQVLKKTFIQGAPQEDGNFTFTLGVTDVNGSQGNRVYTLSVGALMITDGVQSGVGQYQLPNAVVGTMYSQKLHVNVDQPVEPITWSIIAGSLPPGLTLNASTGVISGIPSTDGPFNFTVEARDVSGAFATKSFD